MNWIRWENTLINLQYVKSFFIHKRGSDEEDSNLPLWAITIYMFDKEGKYVRHFESKKEAYEFYEEIAKQVKALVW